MICKVHCGSPYDVIMQNEYSAVIVLHRNTHNAYCACDDTHRNCWCFLLPHDVLCITAVCHRVNHKFAVLRFKRIIIDGALL